MIDVAIVAVLILNLIIVGLAGIVFHFLKEKLRDIAITRTLVEHIRTELTSDMQNITLSIAKLDGQIMAYASVNEERYLGLQKEIGYLKDSLREVKETYGQRLTQIEHKLVKL